MRVRYMRVLFYACALKNPFFNALKDFIPLPPLFVKGGFYSCLNRLKTAKMWCVPLDTNLKNIRF